MKKNYFIKHPTNKNEITQMVNMPSSSLEQNEFLAQGIIRKNILLKDCFILIMNRKVLGRVVIDGDFISCYTLEIIEQSIANDFIKYIVEQRQRRFASHLYSDKKNHDLILKSFLRNDFHIVSEKISYVMKPQKNDIVSNNIQIDKQIDQKTLFEIVKEVSLETLDRSIQKDIEGHKIDEAIFTMLTKLDSSEDKFCLIDYQEGQPTGFVILNKLTEGIWGIGYIGVVPKYRGHKISQKLLRISSNVLFEIGCSELIADVDKLNIPMLKSLEQCGFIHSCDELVLIREVSDKTKIELFLG